MGPAQVDHRRDDDDVADEQRRDGLGEDDPNTAAAVPCTNTVARTRNTVDTTPETRFIRTGVPSRSENSPSRRVKNAPSAAATACMRSVAIIQAEPCVSSAYTNATAVSVSSGPDNGPKTP